MSQCRLTNIVAGYCFRNSARMTDQL